MFRKLKEAKYRKWTIILGKDIDIPTILLISPSGHDHRIPYDIEKYFFKYFDTGDKKYLRIGIEKAKKYLEKQGYRVSGQKKSVVDEEILHFLTTHPYLSFTPREIAKAIRRDTTYVWDRLQVLVKRGKVVKVGKGRYMLKPSWMR